MSAASCFPRSIIRLLLVLALVPLLACQHYGNTARAAQSTEAACQNTKWYAVANDIVDDVVKGFGAETFQKRLTNLQVELVCLLNSTPLALRTDIESALKQFLEKSDDDTLNNLSSKIHDAALRAAQQSSKGMADFGVLGSLLIAVEEERRRRGLCNDDEAQRLRGELIWRAIDTEGEYQTAILESRYTYVARFGLGWSWIRKIDGKRREPLRTCEEAVDVWIVETGNDVNAVLRNDPIASNFETLTDKWKSVGKFLPASYDEAHPDKKAEPNKVTQACK